MRHVEIGATPDKNTNTVESVLGARFAYFTFTKERHSHNAEGLCHQSGSCISARKANGMITFEVNTRAFARMTQNEVIGQLALARRLPITWHNYYSGHNYRGGITVLDNLERLYS